MAVAEVIDHRDLLSDQLTPRSAAQTLVGYQENHQIELFMQEMLSVVFSLLPEDPFEYMTYHIASHRPAPPPPNDDKLCGSGALWVLLPGGDPLAADHWRLRRCWLTDNGVFCISNTAANVRQAEGGSLLITPPGNSVPQRIPLELRASFREYDEDEAARPFAFVVSAGPGPNAQQLQLAAGSEEQRDEWFRLFGHFADATKRKGPAPKSDKVLSPRVLEPPRNLPAAGATNASFSSSKEVTLTSANVPASASNGGYPSLQKTLQEETLAATCAPPRPPTFKHAMDVPPANLARPPLKPILKTRAVEAVKTATVPAIRIPRGLHDDPMEAVSSSRRTSIRFSSNVEKREFPVARAEPVPLSLRAHESRRKIQMGTKVDKGFAPEPRSPRQGTATADAIDVNQLPEPIKQSSKEIGEAKDAPTVQLSTQQVLEVAAKVLSETVSAGDISVDEAQDIIMENISLPLEPLRSAFSSRPDRKSVV